MNRRSFVGAVISALAGIVGFGRGASDAAGAHNPGLVGSTPTPATIFREEVGRLMDLRSEQMKRMIEIDEWYDAEHHALRVEA